MVSQSNLEEQYKCLSLLLFPRVQNHNVIPVSDVSFPNKDTDKEHFLAWMMQIKNAFCIDGAITSDSYSNRRSFSTARKRFATKYW